jgi:pimeloyl-ACP methyl ester carboxylesterase
MIPGADVIELQCGSLRFTAYSMGQGPLVLLLHGFPDTPSTFRHQLPFLARHGFRAVAVTLRGYEPSSRPSDGKYYLHNLANDVLDWMAALGESRAHLVGHDWGATIAFAAARLRPEAFASLALMAVPQPARFAQLLRGDRVQQRRSSYMLFFQLRGIAEFLVRIRNFAYLERLWAKWSPGWADGKATLAEVKSAFRQPGVLRAALSYYRQALDTKSADAKAGVPLLLPPLPVPTLGIFGHRDGCIGSEIFQKSMLAEDFPAGVELAGFKSAGHFVHQECADSVNARWLAFASVVR